MRYLVSVLCLIIPIACFSQSAKDGGGPRIEDYAVVLVSPVPGHESIALTADKAGNPERIPVSQLAVAFKFGNVPITLGDLLSVQNELQKQLKELNQDYNRLAARYNRLAAVSDEPVNGVRSTLSEQQIMRLMQYQNILKSTVQPQTQRIDVRVSDCTAYPALCATPR